MGRSSKHRANETDTGQEPALDETSKSSKLSFTRKGHQRKKSSTQDDAALTIQDIPDLAEYKHLFNDDDEVTEAYRPDCAAEEPDGLAYPKRVASASVQRDFQKSLSRTSAHASTANQDMSSSLSRISAGPLGASATLYRGTSLGQPVSGASTTAARPLWQSSRFSDTRSTVPVEKPLPRLLAPRQTPVPEALQDAHHQPSEDDPLTVDDLEDPAADMDATGTLGTSMKKTKKKRHSTMGHIWKTLTHPKATASNIQSLSMTAVRGATEVVMAVTHRAEEDLGNLRDEILGGKRNLPDHPAKPVAKSVNQSTASMQGLKAKDPNSPPPTAVIIAVTADTGRGKASDGISSRQSAVGLSTSGNASQGTATAATGDVTPLSKTRSAKTLKAWLRPTSDQPASAGGHGVLQGSSSTAGAQETVERSRGSAYMLSKYEDAEPESPSALAEALLKTAEVLTQGTERMLDTANGSARYLRRVLMCGMGGRNKN